MTERTHPKYHEVERTLRSMHQVRVRGTSPPNKVTGIAEIVIEYSPFHRLVDYFVRAVSRRPKSSLRRVEKRLASHSNIGKPNSEGFCFRDRIGLEYVDGNSKIRVTEDPAVVHYRKITNS